MAINIDATALEARYAKQGAVVQSPQGEPPPIYGPGTSAAQIPVGQPVPEGVVIQQIVGRGQPAQISVVPPTIPGGPPPPQIAVVPPSGANRTSIGTYVEVSPTVSNPLTASPAPIPSGTVAPPIEPPPKEPPKKRKLDLTQLILDHIFELGGEDGEEAQKFYDRSNQTLKNWCRNPGVIPLQAVLKFISRKPGIPDMILEELEPHFAILDGGTGIQSLPNRGKLSVVVCAPIMGEPKLPFMWSLLYLAKKYELGFDVQADTVIWRSRNMLAKRFLASGASWSLWLDSDMAAPIANAEWFRWITGSETVPDEACRYDVLARLMGHGKAMIGAVYASRRLHGQLVMQPEINPRGHEDLLLCNEIRRGTARGLAAVDWIGFGCALVHREVFLEVQRRFPQLAPQSEFGPWRYFQPVGDEGEDEAFCQRVKACSIPIWLDTQLVCGHIGNTCYLPEHTRPKPAL
jgi:hypothetical protein